jgi:hypothetical protein
MGFSDDEDMGQPVCMEVTVRWQVEKNGRQKREGDQDDLILILQIYVQN